MNGQSNGSLRVLAPIALVVFGIVFFIVVTSSLSGGDEFAQEPVDFGAGQTKVKKDKPDKTPVGVDTTTETVPDLTTETDSSELDPVATDTTSTTLSPTTKTSYTVKPGDTLEAISAKTGVPVDELSTLNPEIDPQALVAGSKLKLTE